MIIKVQNGAQLLKALKAAHSGDTILLAAGTYNNVSISGYNFAAGVTIASADPTHEAVVSNLTVSNSSGLNFQQLDLTTTTGTAVTVSGSQNISFNQDTFSGSAAGVGNAMMLRSSSNITVTGSDFGNFGTGINVLTDSNLTITNNTFHGITGGAIRGTGVTASTISGNTFTDASTTVPTHTDVLYLWQDNTANQVTVSNNFYGPPLPAVLTTTTQLIEALQNAHAGQVIQLAAGVYDAAALSNFQFSTAVTITSADPTHEAVLTNLTVSGSSGLVFQGVTFGTATGTAASVTGSQAITFTGDIFAGPGAGTGAAMTVSNSNGVTVTSSDIGKFATGLNLQSDSNLSVTGNTFHDITGADVLGAAVTNSTISGNNFANASYASTTHTDVLNLSQDNTASNVSISNNTYGVALTNTQLLVAELQNAQPGAVIKLAAGTYDGAVLNNLHFASNVTITSADPTHEAVISNLTVSNSSGLVFQGVDLTTSTGTAVTVTGSQAITFSNDTFSGPGAGVGNALLLNSSSGVTVTNSDFAHFNTGINLATDSNLSITGNSFEDITGGDLRGTGLTNSTISGNAFTNASPTVTNHQDVLYLWGQDNTVNNVTISGNTYGSANVVTANVVTANVVTVSSVQQLETALANAHGGDVIALAAGVYNAPGFYNSFSTPVTIMSADPNNHAVLQDVDINGASGITFADLTLSTATGTAVHVSNASNLVFSHDAFSGPNDTTSTAMTMTSSSGVTVTGSDFDHFNMGFNLGTDSGLTISNNTFEDIGGGSAMAGRGVTNSTISGNDFSFANPTATNHSDAISLWQDNTANNVTISGNTYGSGSTAVTDSSTPVASTNSTSSTSSTTTTTTTTTSTTTTSAPSATGAAATTVTVNSTQGLMDALHTAQAGEVIKLAAGSYGDLGLWGLHFGGAGVTITSADTSNEAVVSSINTDSTTGLNIDHLKVQMAAGNTGPAVQLINGSNVNVSYLTLTGTGASGAYNGTGVLVRNETGASVTHSDFGQLNIGVNATDASNVTISNNTVHDLSQDGIDSSGSSNVVIQGNSFTNFTPGYGVHPDAIQFSADGNGVHGSNILVEDNVITRGTGAIFQGIFVENTGHIEITGNAMAGTMYNGISLSTTDTGLVSNNFVEGFTDMTSWIITRNVSSNVSVLNNAVTAIQNYADGGVANPNYFESGTTFIQQANVGDYTAMNAWVAQHSASTASLSDSFFLH